MKTSRQLTRVLAIGFLTSVGTAHAGDNQSAADLLMQISTPSQANAGVSGLSSTTDSSVVLNTPLARVVFAEWNTNQGKSAHLTFEANTWVQMFLAEKYEASAHLWGAISPKLPDSFSPTAKAAYLYSLYKLGLHQTFFDQWMTALSSHSFAESRASAALEETLSPDFEAWLQKNLVLISPDAATVITRLGAGRSLVFLTLNAALMERKGEVASEILAKLPVNSAYRPTLAQTVAVGLAKKRDLGGAGRILKNFYEPWLLTAKDSRKTSSYYLQIARLLYQAGSFDAAKTYYEKIPNGSPDYLTAREELAWVWLRQGDSEKLRGNLKTLTSQLLEDQFQPEAYLVRAISNLKLCYHADVQKDFADFLRVNQNWAATIQKNLKASDPGSPRTPDLYAQRAQLGEKARESEITLLKGLAERSIAAVLPAVGPQKHWLDALQKASLNLETAKKARVAEYRRQWKNDQATLVEAIRKMQFVKVELMSQLALLGLNNLQNGGVTAGLSGSKNEATQVALAKASGVESSEALSKTKIRAEGDMVFPFDGVVWPDELFKLRSQSNSQCLGRL